MAHRQSIDAENAACVGLTARAAPLSMRVSIHSALFTMGKNARHHHHVYVVELSRRVMQEPRFAKANAHYMGDKPCVYVGMTGLSPDERFDKHKAGIKANRFVREYGLHLLPQLYECFNPMPYGAAAEMEVELAIGLREAGYAVWQA